MKEDLVPMEQATDIPVYLFTGFMDAGKTKFIQETLEDKRFETGERTLLIVCEEGEEEYAPDQFAGKKVMIRLADSEEDFTEELLAQWELETGAERVLIEWNGMWMLDTLYSAMPPRWVVAQEFMFAEAESFLLYNTNLRQLVYDKLKSCELVVFNRFDPAWDIMPYHKIVRGANRSCDIAYEDPKGKVRYDDIEDPLPFDLDAPVVEIEDADYAVFYRDLSEEMQKYAGKTIRFKGLVARDNLLGKNGFLAGRHVMTCCEADIAFHPLVCICKEEFSAKTGDWVTVTGEVRIEKHKLYRGEGPVVYVKSSSFAVKPVQEVATFY